MTAAQQLNIFVKFRMDYLHCVYNKKRNNKKRNEKNLKKNTNDIII